MKKLVSIVLSIFILSSVIIAVPAIASGAVYVKGTVVKVSFTADDVDKPFTGLEGSLSFGSDLTLTADSVKYPHIGDMQSAVYEGKVVFNSSSLSNYDISPDKEIVSAEFTVNSDVSELPVNAVLDDIYYRDGAKLVGFDNITLPYALKANVTVIYSPVTEAPSTEGDTNTPSTPDETDTGAVVETTESSSQPFDTGATEEITEPVNTEETEDNTSLVPTSGSIPSTDSTETYFVPTNTDETGIIIPTDNTEYPTGTEAAPTGSKPSETVPPVTAPTQPQSGATDPTEVKTEIKLSKTSASLYVKGTTKIKATVKNGNGATTYKSNKTKVAKVNKNGKVTALKKGTAVITVANNGVKKTFKVKVKNPKLNKKKVKLKKGKTFKLKVIGKKGKAKFKSSKKKIATVSKSGKIKAKKKGKAVITVTTNGKIKLKCKVTVK